MSSDTPRTDAAYLRPGATLYDLAGEIGKLERELYATLAQIAELNEETAFLRKRLTNATAALKFIADHGGTIHATECGEIHCSAAWCAEQARAALNACDFARQLERELSTAQARIAELDKEKARLDWLEENGDQIHCSECWAGNIDQYWVAPTRAAIDAEMKERKP